MSGTVEPYRFATPKADRATDPAPLQEIADQLTRGLSALLESYLGQPVLVQAKPPRFTTFGKWSQAQAAFLDLSAHHVPAARGRVALALDETFVAVLTSRHFGGAVAKTKRRADPRFARSERQQAERFAARFMALFGGLSDTSADTESQVIARETSAFDLRGWQSGRELVAFAFTANAGKELDWPIECAFEDETATALIASWAQASAPDLPAIGGAEWVDGWRRALGRVRLPVRTVLAQPTMTLPELRALKVGDFVPLTPRAITPLYVADRRFGTGKLGRQNGCAAFRLDRIEREDHA